VDDVARAAGVDFLDLSPTLKAEAEAGRLVYLADDTHWSAEGHRAAAAAIAERIGDRARAGGRLAFTSTASPRASGSTARTR
jgi:lysophospholipase L1-like esterase